MPMGGSGVNGLRFWKLVCFLVDLMSLLCNILLLNFILFLQGTRVLVGFGIQCFFLLIVLSMSVVGCLASNNTR